jgi:2-keto-4-pentenoate hydratase/2-oxohepta-3-ene-1,7-dioic acid hydratase in catechol pathway
MVTRDQIPDPQNLTLHTYLNDLEVCKAHTSEMLFSIRQFIASLSRVFPLEPGDVLATGSPPGARHVSRSADPGAGRRRDAH